MNRNNSGANTNIKQILTDVCVILVAYGITLWSFIFFKEGFEYDTLNNLHVVVLLFGVVFMLSNKEEYLYNVTLFYYLDRIHRKITKSFLIATLVTTAAIFYMDRMDNNRDFYLVFLILIYALFSLKIVISRQVFLKYSFRNAPRTVFVGKIGAFNKFQYFVEKTSIKINLIGYIATERSYMDTDERYIGCLEDLEETIRTHSVDQVYIMQKNDDALPFTQKYVDVCIAMGVTVRLIVDFYKRRRASSYVSTVGTYPIITYHTVCLNQRERILKRIMDILGSLVGIILSSPFMLITAIAIKIDSRGPIIFKQIRVGQNGRHFKIYKFRSMYINAEERKKELLAQNEIEGGVMFKMKNDPRITRVGRIIRKLSIDELPQFFNVLIGNMSLVGTRPPTLDEVEKYKTNQWRRISMKPGITGMWQVNGRSEVKNFDDIVELDVEYIDNWDLFMDIKIILKTVVVLIRRKGSY